MPKFVIVGAGVAGLSAAWELLGRGETDFLLLEAAPRPGGVAATELDRGFLFERGPDSFLTAKPAAAQLCRELGLGGELVPMLPGAAARILRHGRFHPLPSGWRLGAPTQLAPLLASGLFSIADRVRIAAHWRRSHASPHPVPEEESVGQHLRRRFGPRAGNAMLSAVAGPLLAGIYGGDADNLIMPHPTQSSLPPSAPPPPPFTSLRSGLGSLIAALVARLPPSCLRLQTPVAMLLPLPNSGFRLQLASGATLEAANLVLALPAWSAAAITPRLCPDLAQALAAFPYASSANVNLGYRQAPSLPPGSGFLVARDLARRQPHALLACTFAHQKFPHRAPPGGAILRAFYAGDFSPGDETELARRAQSELGQILGFHAAPDAVCVTRSVRSMPQYSLGHRARLDHLARALMPWPTLVLAGNAYHGVGVPDCVESGRAAIQRLVKREISAQL